ncbi:hypothetical protein RR46_05468 [Papilio xuthus]|uniref:Uncharacterized protein n=1 Tax=Papilio xuthus TaxID=66420 RepID=A0A194Q2Q7_PAPXU|nr:hypothetical protein RR46_05468 [Papilio xuthus]
MSFAVGFIEILTNEVRSTRRVLHKVTPRPEFVMYVQRRQELTGETRRVQRVEDITDVVTYPTTNDGSTQPQCNGGASPWGNRLRDHGSPYAR